MTSPAAAPAPSAPEEALPLPQWLKVLYFVFPVVLYTPDALFNYYVYSDGVNVPQGNALAAIASAGLWGLLSVGVVGMAYLLSVLAPWHWGRGRYIQAFFCSVGVVIATAITIWNSLAYRSQSFHAFVTDQWVYSIWPQLQVAHFSLTMVLVAVAPPAWGLFWAIVQPTETRRDASALQEAHAERLLRIQHEAEMKAAKAQANANVREAQLRGMAQTAAAARDQAAKLVRRDQAEQEAPVEEEPTQPALAPALLEEAPEAVSATPVAPDGAPAEAPAAPRPRVSSAPRTRRPRTAKAAVQPEAQVEEQEPVTPPPTSRPSIPRPAAASRRQSWTATEDDEQTAQEARQEALAAARRRQSWSTYPQATDEPVLRPGSPVDMSHVTTPAQRLAGALGRADEEAHTYN